MTTITAPLPGWAIVVYETPPGSASHTAEIENPYGWPTTASGIGADSAILSAIAVMPSTIEMPLEIREWIWEQTTQAVLRKFAT